MSIAIFSTPKKVTPEQWFEILAEVISKCYGLDSCESIIKKAIFDSSDASGVVTYKNFINELRKVNNDKNDGNEYQARIEIADRICPMYLKKNEWTAYFDDKDGKPLEGLGAKALRIALKESYDRNFTNLVVMLWTKVNLPEAYCMLY